MTWYEAIILGIVQGLTEFLPVSSSGHLVIGRELLGIEAGDDLVFEVVVHAATVLSTILVFRKIIWDLLKGLFKFKYNSETDYILKIAVSMIPILIVGLFFKDFVEGLFGSLLSVGVALVVTAILLTFSDFMSKWRAAGGAISAGNVAPGAVSEQKTAAGEDAAAGKKADITYWQALVVGLSQAVAVIPGLSRSGTTIATGLLCGVKRDAMAQFSFLMVLVPILGEAFLQAASGEMASSSVGALPLVLGFLAAFISGLFACKVMIALVKKAKLSWFALYCGIVAILIAIFG